MKKLFLFILLLLASKSVYAETQQKGEMDFHFTTFPYERENHDVNDWLILDTHYLLHYNNEKNFILHVDPRLKLNFLDTDQNRYLPHSAYMGFYNQTFDFRFGLQKITWGSGALFNPQDVLNRPDLGANYVLREKLSDPIVSFSIANSPSSTTHIELSSHILPLFLTTPLPSDDSRFRLSGEQNSIPYTLSFEQDKLDYKKSIGKALALSLKNQTWDVTFYGYQGPEHVPGYALKIDENGALKLKPFYYEINMLALQSDLTINTLTLKSSLVYKNTDRNDTYPHDIQPVEDDAIPESHFEYLFGLDYNLPSKSETVQNTFSLEYLGHSQNQGAYSSPILLQSDVLFAIKSLSQSGKRSAFMAGFLKDIGSKEWLAMTDFSFLLFEQIRLGSQCFYTKTSPDSALDMFDNPAYFKAYLTFQLSKRNNE